VVSGLIVAVPRANPCSVISIGRDRGRRLCSLG
jgi:hypothetical protein